MKKLCSAFAVFMLFCCDFFAQTEASGINDIANNPQEAFYYIKQLETFYPLLWKGESESLKDYRVDAYGEERDAICTFQIAEIRIGGPLDERRKIAEQQGFFTLMKNAADAPRKSVVDLRETLSDTRGSAHKIIATLLICRYIYYLQILQQAERGEWTDVARHLTSWASVISTVRPNGTFQVHLEKLLDHLLAKYSIPDREKNTLLTLKKRLSDQKAELK